MSFESYYIGDRCLTKLPCPLCGHEMLSHAMEFNQDHTYSTERGLIEAVAYDNARLCVESQCRTCGGHVYIRDADLHRLNLVVRYPAENLEEEVEYYYMSIASVKYGRVRNRGNYETDRLEVEYAVEDGQTPEQALREAKRFVNKQLDLGPSDKDVKAARELLIEAGELSD